MSEKDLFDIIGRFNRDVKFAGQLLRNFDQAVLDNGYLLDADEMSKAKASFNKTDGTPLPPEGETSHISSESQAFTPEQLLQQQDALKRSSDLQAFTLGIFKGTLNNAKLTYQLITVMNGVMFCMGVGLFLFAAIYGTVSQNGKFTAALAGLGTASFITLLMITPIDKIQDALSNLIQAEVAFMNYYEQMIFLEGFALGAWAGSENVKKASDLLQERTGQTLELLQTYLENRHGKTRRKKQGGADSKPKISDAAQETNS
jgi:hypothetical protein